MTTPTYDEYILSPTWKRRREAVLRAAKWTCARCGGVAGEVHHLTYDRLGEEQPGDLEPLCRPCHNLADEERRRHDQRRRYQRRLDGWASKVYGDSWHLDLDPSIVEAEFDQWLDGQR